MSTSMSTSRILTRFLLSVWVLAAVLGIVSLYLKPDAVSHLSAEVETPGAMVVVELFTSEGCSSCPLADALLTQLEADSRKKGQPVYYLTYPVGSGDDSVAAVTERLAAYSKKLGATHLDSPHMIVNGTEQLMGSDKAQAVRAITQGLSRVAPVRIEMTASANDREILVECQIQNAPEGAMLNVAWVDSTATATPHPGENPGREVKHVHVVRDFQSVPLSEAFEGTVRLRRPENRDGQVIAFVQQPGPGRVLGATSVPVSGE